MFPAVVWTALLTAALLTYPRRPRTAGALLIGLGLWTFLLRYMHWGSGRVASGVWTASWVAALWLAIGVSWIVKFSNRDTRAAHVGYWTAKS
jgi:hypothetical protein